MMQRTSVRAQFVVTGEALTEMARNLLLSEEPGKAYRLLADGLNGPGAMEAALKVLAGTHDLAGDSMAGIELVEAKDTPALRRFREDFRYIYAGRFQDGRVWRRPVAWIVWLGRKDGDWASRRLEGDIGSGAQKLMRFSRERASFYCGPDEVPFVLELPDEGSVWVVFETCGELPHWMRPLQSAQEALDDALKAGRRLEKREPEREPEDKRPVVSRPSAEELERREAEEDRRELERLERHREIGRKVREQAGDDTFQMKVSDGRVLTIARAPFVRWALSRTDDQHKAPPWEPVSQSGEKLSNDDPFHTDWILGAGLELSEAYSRPINEASVEEMCRIQEEARSQVPYAGIFAALEDLRTNVHKAATLSGTKDVTGTVGVDVRVFPDARGERVAELEGCRAVIVERGGPLAHLIVVSKGKGIPVMRCANACELFAAGASVTLQPKAGRIILVAEDD